LKAVSHYKVYDFEKLIASKRCSGVGFSATQSGERPLSDRYASVVGPIAANLNVFRGFRFKYSTTPSTPEGEKKAIQGVLSA
jgi:hypothetical protein